MTSQSLPWQLVSGGSKEQQDTDVLLKDGPRLLDFNTRRRSKDWNNSTAPISVHIQTHQLRLAGGLSKYHCSIDQEHGGAVLWNNRKALWSCADRTLSSNTRNVVDSACLSGRNYLGPKCGERSVGLTDCVAASVQRAANCVFRSRINLFVLNWTVRL